MYTAIPGGKMQLRFGACFSFAKCLSVHRERTPVCILVPSATIANHENFDNRTFACVLVMTPFLMRWNRYGGPKEESAYTMWMEEYWDASSMSTQCLSWSTHELCTLWDDWMWYIPLTGTVSSGKIKGECFPAKQHLTLIVHFLTPGGRGFVRKWRRNPRPDV